jgi:hypothetical protein
MAGRAAIGVEAWTQAFSDSVDFEKDLLAGVERREVRAV